MKIYRIYWLVRIEKFRLWNRRIVCVFF